MVKIVKKRQLEYLQATSEIAFLLNGKSYLYEDYSTEDFSQSADYIYSHLMGLTQKVE